MHHTPTNFYGGSTSSGRPAASVGQVNSEHTSDSQERDRLLYHSAKIIKSDIISCKGILTKSPNASDVSLMTCKFIIPESLYHLLRWIIANPEKDDELSDTACSNISDERRILMLA